MAGRREVGTEERLKQDGLTQRRKRGVYPSLHVCVCVCVYTFPSPLVSRLLITVREKNILGQHVE